MLKRIKSFFVKNNWFIVTLLLIPVFFTGNRYNFGFEYDLVFHIMLWPVAAYVLINYFFIKKKKPSKLMFVFFVYVAWMVLEQFFRARWFTYLNYNNIVRGVVLAVLIETYIDDDILVFIKGIMLNFELAIYPELISLIINYINGQPKADSFLGYYNNVIVFTFTAICIALIYYKLTKNIKRSMALAITSVIVTFMSLAATPMGAMMGFLGLLALEMIFVYWLHMKKIRLWPWLIIALAFNVFIILIYRPGIIPILDNFIINVLHRSTNFTGRTEIWDRAIGYIKESPIIGHGYSPDFDGGAYNWWHSHNEIMNIWVRFGLVGVLMYAAFTFIYVQAIEKQETSFYKMVFIALVFGIYLAFITDCISRAYLYYAIFFLAYHFNKIRDYN